MTPMLWNILLAIAVVASCAVLNRVRGGGFYGDKLPGRALLWVSVAIGLIAWGANPIPLTVFGYTQTWFLGAAYGLGYLFWGVWSWGYTLAALGGYKPARSENVLEATLALLGPAPLQVFVRMLFVLPGVILVAWLLHNWALLGLAPAFAGAATAAYVLLFRPLNALDWTRAEVATGAIWGFLILAPWMLK